MISVDEALGVILERVAPLPPVPVPLSEALGLVLAEDLVAREDHPPFDNAAMDGYAVRACDTAGATPERPAELDLVEELFAGAVPTRAVGPGQACAITTGGVIPEGADAVVRVEETRRSPDRVLVERSAREGQNLRRAGEDVRRGQRVLARGTVLGPAEIGMAAALGYPRVSCHRRPRVALVSVGDELLEPDRPLSPGKIRNSNAYALEAQARHLGAMPLRLPLVPDRLEAVQQTLARALEEADLVVSSAGVSVGERDYVRTALEHLCGELVFWRVRMRPGKPVGFGVARGVPFFGLPGNPVSCMVGFEVFVRPALLKRMGHTRLDPPVVEARLGEAVDKPRGLRTFVRCRLSRRGGDWVAVSTGPQGSGLLRSMVLADGLMDLPEEPSRLEAGERVRVRLLWGSLPASP